MKRNTTLLKTGLLFFFVMITQSILAQQFAFTPVAYDSQLIIKNKSKWNIEYVYISPTSSDSWGTDILGDVYVLKTGEEILVYLKCENYDVKLVDEDGDECIINNQRLCNSTGDTWIITDQSLLECQGGN